MKNVFAFATAVLLSACPTVADAQVESGPLAGEVPKPFKASVAVGDKAETTVDCAAERAAKPTVYLFVPGERWTRPVARFLHTIDKALETGEGAEGATAVAVWLTEDPAKFKENLPRVQQSLKFKKTTLAVYEPSKFGPEGWSINDAADVTAVIVSGGKVIKSLAIESAGETDAARVTEFLKPSK